MDITPKEIFEVRIAKAIGKNPAIAKEVNAIFQFDISGPEGGKWTLDLTKESDWVSIGHNGTPNMTIAAVDTDFIAIVSGKMNGQMAFMTGKLKLKPLDIALAAKLTKVLSSGRAPPPPPAA